MKRLVLTLLAVVFAAVAAAWIIGLMLPTDHVAVQSRWYPVPRDSVWTAITNVRDYPAWRDDLDSVTVLDDAMQWREYGSFGAITFAAEEMAPGERLVTRIVDRDLGFGGRWTYELADSANGTRLTITENGEITNAFFRTISRYVTGYDATMRQYLDDLAARNAARGR